MKRFKRPITEVAKGMFHGGSEGPIIPNLGVNSKEAEGSSPSKMLLGKQDLKKAKEKTQSQKNAETRKSGKAVSYKDAYADADKKKYKTYEEFEKAAKSYNKEKYNTTNPTADAKKAGKTKAQLAKDVAAKNAKDKDAPDTSNKVDQPTPKAKTVTKAEKITAKGDAKVERIKARKAKRAERKEARVEKRTERKANRAANKAARKESRAKIKAARKGEVEVESSAAKYGKKHK